MILNLFPTSIKYIKNFLNQEEVDRVINLYKNYNQNAHKTLKGDASSSHYDYNNIVANSFLEQKLIKIIEEYSIEIGIRKQCIDISWINIQRKDSKLLKHNHTTSPVSGVIYLKVDNYSSPLYLYNPNPYVYVTNTIQDKETNFHYVSFKPEIGDLFLFPGWLFHGSDEQKNKSDERIALSFNTKDAV